MFINGKALACVTSAHYLGVIVDQHLTWKSHVNYVLKRCIFYALNHMKPLPDYMVSQLQWRIQDGAFEANAPHLLSPCGGA